MTIPAQFRDGPLAGQVLDVDLEQHNFTHRKTGAEYVRITEWDAARRELVSYFVMREKIYAKAKQGG